MTKYSKHHIRFFYGDPASVSRNAEIHVRLYNHPSVSGRRFNGCSIITSKINRGQWLSNLDTSSAEVKNVSVITPELFAQMDPARMKPTLFLVAEVTPLQHRHVLEVMIRNRFQPEYITV